VALTAAVVTETFPTGAMRQPRLNERDQTTLPRLKVSDVRRAAELEAIRRKLIPLTAYRQLLNGPEHVSGWLAVDQSMIDTFADATNDHQFIHTDRQRAESETPFGGTIAHGFLTLSLLSALAFDAMPGVEGTRMGVNYGFERVRFLSPVKSGARVRCKFRLIGLTERAVSIQSAWDTVVEVEGLIKPAIEAHWITLALIDPDGPPVRAG
jgi:acyl dehydratase